MFSGRSLCPKCKNKISWFDNIPLLSFLLLKGKCRNCGKKISGRYPLIEFSTAVLFLGFFLSINNCATALQGLPLKGGVICTWQGVLGGFTLPYFLVMFTVLIAIFVIDFERQIIPDSLIYLLFALTFTLLLIFSPLEIYSRLLSGFGISLFLLIIHLVTGGRGMGLGDVKFVLFGGLLLGWPAVITWIFLSFLIGGVTGLFLIILKKASFGKHIPFGPFLIIGLIITLIWEDILQIAFLLP